MENEFQEMDFLATVIEAHTLHGAQCTLPGGPILYMWRGSYAVSMQHLGSFPRRTARPLAVAEAIKRFGGSWIGVVEWRRMRRPPAAWEGVIAAPRWRVTLAMLMPCLCSCAFVAEWSGSRRVLPPCGAWRATDGPSRGTLADALDLLDARGMR